MARCCFTVDGSLFACRGHDGRVRVWEAVSGRLKHEFTAEEHLTASTSVLAWIQTRNASTPSPWKKRRKKHSMEDSPQRSLLALGSSSGAVTLLDPSKGSVVHTLEGHGSGVTALTYHEVSGLLSAGEDHQLIHWSLEESSKRHSWRSGKSKTCVLAVCHDGTKLVSGERSLKLWSLESYELLRTFPAHSGPVSCLCVLCVGEEWYALSGAQGDSCVSVWALEEGRSEKNVVATLALQDDPVGLSSGQSESGQACVLATTRSGQAQLFHYQPNGRSKPLKPSLTLAVASENAKEVQPVPIIAARLTEDLKLSIVWGQRNCPNFETVAPEFGEKVQCLVRSDTKKKEIWERKEEIAKVKQTIIEEDVEYLAPGIPEPTPKRSRSSSGSQLPLRDRLENLSLATESSCARASTKGGNMAQLLMQGLNSKDRAILASVLFTKNENVVRNTVAKLPVQAITPLLKELAVLLQGKTYASKVAVKWLEALLTTHAGHFLSRPDLSESFGPILSYVDAKLSLLTEVSRLKGRVSLVTGQIAQNNEENDKTVDDSVLVYQDPDSTDEDEGLEEEDLESESESWEEENDDEIRSQKSQDDDDSICS